MSGKSLATAVLLGCLLLKDGLAADKPSTSVNAAALADRILAVQKTNTASLNAYCWTSTFRVLREGEQQYERINRVHMGPNGERQVQMLRENPVPEAKGGLQGMIQKRKQKFMRSLVELGDAYRDPPAEKLTAFLRTASVTTEANEQGEYLRVRGRGLVQSGDQVTMRFDPTTLRPLGTTFQSELDGMAVEGKFSYALIQQDGLYALTGQVLAIPEKNLEIAVRNTRPALDSSE